MPTPAEFIKTSDLPNKTSGFSAADFLAIVSEGTSWRVSFSILANVFLEIMAGANWVLAMNSQWTQYNTEDQETNFQRARQFFGSGFWRIFSEKGGSEQVVPIDIGVIADLQTHLVMQEPGVADVPVFSFLYHGFAAQKSAGVFRFGSTDPMTQNAGDNIFAYIAPYYNQSGTAGAFDLVINRNVTALGSGKQRFISLRDTDEEILGFTPDGKLVNGDDDPIQNFINRTHFDVSGVKSADLSQRIFYDTSETPVFDFGVRRIYSPTDEILIDVGEDEITLIKNPTVMPGGVLQLGNAAVAGAIVPTHSVTIKDGAGVSYKIPVVAA